ncbi:MAG: DUF4062 domain-containing protein [Candidatus Methanoperedens sp.]|nr:DUF4062 domain-containing protein [Candidatus Methanoperedens sp.]
MGKTWNTVDIFISSTFNDMHAERDYLVRFVFPELRDRCANRRIRLMDIDLRWGVTEEEAENGKVLEICLDEIDRSRPFFIGLLGERYGWVPSKYDVPDDPRYDWVRKFERGYSITAMEIYHGVLRNPTMKMHAYFYFRDPAFLIDLPYEHQKFFSSENEEAASRLKHLKDIIRKQYPVLENYPCAYGGIGEDGKVRLIGLEAFGQRVLEDLWSAICQEYPEEEIPPDDLAVEEAYHEAFIEGRSRRFIGRLDILKQMTEFVDGDNAAPLIITGAPGCGKSALLAKFVRAYTESHNEVFVLPHFIGVSPGSTDIRRTLLRLCHQFSRYFNMANEIPEEYEQLRKVFFMLLEEAASHGKVLLVLDALNQLDESYRAHSLNWLPRTLPPGLRLIVSTLEGDCLDALHNRRPAPSEIIVGPLGEEDRKQIVRQTLWDYRKQLDETPENDQMKLLLKKIESDNPLYLAVACEELRVFGKFEWINERIASLPGDIPTLFEQVLERLEHDHGEGLVNSALSLLECSRHGLLETEMLELLQHEKGEQFPRAIWAQLYRSLKFYLCPPGESGEGALDFFHRQLSKAVRRRYLHIEERNTTASGHFLDSLHRRLLKAMWNRKTEEKETAVHRRLAEYFHRKADPIGDATWTGNYPRGLSVLAYHQTRGQTWKELEEMLCNLEFIEAKCSVGMTYELIDDYRQAAIAVPDSEGKRHIKEFETFLIAEAHILSIMPELTYQQSANQLDSTDPAKVAYINRSRRPWLKWLNKPLEKKACLVTFSSGLNEISCSALDPAGYRVAVIQFDTVHIIDIETGVQVAEFNAGCQEVTSCCFSTDGKSLFCGYKDGNITLWNIDYGKIQAVFSGHSEGVSSLCAKKWMLFSVSFDGTARVWDITRGNCLKAIESLSPQLYCCAVHPSKPWLVIGGTDARFEIWDFEDVHCIARMAGNVISVDGTSEFLIKYRDKISDCVFSGNGRFLALAQADRREGALYVLEITSNGILNRFVIPSSSLIPSVPKRQSLLNRAIKGPGGIWQCSLGISKPWAIATDAEGDIILMQPYGKSYIVRIVSKAHQHRCVLCRQTSDDGKLVTVDETGTCRVWSIAALPKDAIAVEEAIVNILNGYASPSGENIVVCREDGMLAIWNIRAGKFTRIFDEMSFFCDHDVRCAAWTPDNKFIISGSEEDFYADIWESGGTHLGAFDIGGGFVADCAVSLDGSFYAFVSEGGLVTVWEPLGYFKPGDMHRRPLQSFHRRSHSPRACCFGSDSEELTVVWNDGILTLWNWKKNKICWEKQVHEGAANDCAVNPKTGLIATAGEDGYVKLWSPAEGDAVALKNMGAPATVCRFSSCGRWLAVCAGDVSILDGETLSTLARFPYRKKIAFVDFIALSGRLCIGCSDGEILLAQIVDESTTTCAAKP